MTFTTSQPSASQNISSGQASILGNFQYLGSTASLSGKTASITTGGNTIKASGGWYNLPNGLIVQYAVVTATAGSLGNNAVIPFLTAWTSGVLSTQLTGISSGTSGQGLFVKPGTATTTQFQISTSNTWSNGIYYLSIGY